MRKASMAVVFFYAAKNLSECTLAASLFLC